MKPNQYQCHMCKGVFDKEWSDEEAKAEHDRDFPGESLDTACVMCDDCYQKVRPDTHPLQMAQYIAAKEGATLMDLLPLLTAPSSSPPPASEATPSAASDSPLASSG